MARIGRKQALAWIAEDFQKNRTRFIVEIVGMCSNLMAALILMWFSPNPPMFWAYIFFLIASALLLWAAYSRRSVGFALMYLVYLGIDGIGFIKTLL